jgi:hypothetical protein
MQLSDNQQSNPIFSNSREQKERAAPKARPSFQIHAENS